AQQVGAGGLVDAAVLADVERGEAESEGRGLHAEVGERTFGGERAEAGLAEALGDQVEVGAEGLGGVARLLALRRVEQAVEPGLHEQELEAERLVRVLPPPP